ncbi:MAG: hypothetical protein NZ739_06945 [Verrucomicrobiae bacterium]|nr:hypothetical protein [Verrucomicrobiae bacterium]MDW7981016.1 hypothetical protein [Verrucomicrobiales bacterium]
MKPRLWIAVSICAVILWVVANSNGASYDIIGKYTNWPTAWVPIPGLADPNDNLTRYWLDFVGDTTYPVGYWTATHDYVFFRMRVRSNAPPSNFSDSVFVLIDVVGDSQEYVPQFGFVWDSNQRVQDHGLEMVKLGTLGTTWGATTMDDIDNSSGQKLSNDINGGGRTTDGYVRLTDSIPAGGFGTTTFLDFAVAWNYLTNYTSLAPTQRWRITFASIDNANDHNQLRYDIAGGAGPTSPVTNGWSGVITIPEPALPAQFALVAGLIGFAAVVSKRGRRSSA